MKKQAILLQSQKRWITLSIIEATASSLCAGLIEVLESEVIKSLENYTPSYQLL